MSKLRNKKWWLMKNVVLVLLVLLFFVSQSFSQESRGKSGFGGSISGSVYDFSSNLPIEYANVIMFSSKDSTQITGTVSDKEGLYNIIGIKPGRYYLKIQFIGYEKHTIDNVTIDKNNPTVTIDRIMLKPSSINLENVVVKGERTPVAFKIDKKIIDVEQMPIAVSGNATDVLENIPSVTVDIDGNVSVRGSSNFTVLIDGRPSVISAQDALQQIPASSIKTIELVTNPSAKYDPEGTAGIINIILKKDQNLGISGIANANAGGTERFGGDFLFEYKTSSVKYNFGLDYNQRMHPGSSISERSTTFSNNTNYLNSNGSSEWGREGYGLRGGVDFNLSENDLLGFGLRFGSREHHGNSTMNYISWSDLEPNRSAYISRTSRERAGSYIAGNTNYMHKFSLPGHKFSMDLQVSHDDSDELTSSSEYNNEVQFNGRKTVEAGPSTEVEGKLDYILPLSATAKFEAGSQGEYETSEEKNELLDFNSLSGNFELQDRFSNLTNYTVSELALYSILSNEWGNLGLQGGIRGEYTFRTIDVKISNQQFSIDEWEYFPTLHGSYKFSPVTQAMLSYTKRIERPRNWALEPFETWIDANNVRRGNPALRPEYIDSYEFGFQTLLGEISISNELYYRVTKNKIDDVRSVYGEDITLNSVENIGKDYALGSEFMIVVDPLPFWNLNVMGNLYDYRIEGRLNEENLSRSSFTWNTRLNNVFKIGKSTQLQINGMYNSPSVSSQGRSEDFFIINGAIKQDLFDKKIALTLQVRDLLSTGKHESTSQGLNFYNYSYHTRQSPMVMLNVRFNFNNYKNESDRRRGDSLEEESGGEQF